MAKFSVITIAYNDIDGLRRTFSSVQAQSFRDFEHIIIDGGSKDGTRDFLTQNSKCFAHALSEPDGGIYDAMNKGLALATGEWAVFLNAGDCFADAEVLDAFAKAGTDPNSVIFGRAQIMASENTHWHFPPDFVTAKNCRYWLGPNLPNHQAMFFPREFYRPNRFNLGLKISADSDYKERAFAAHKWVFVEMVVCQFFMDGLSSSRAFKNQWTQVRDRFARFPAPKRYFDAAISISKAIGRWSAYKLLGAKSYKAIHVVKSTKDRLLIGVKGGKGQ